MNYYSNIEFNKPIAKNITNSNQTSLEDDICNQKQENSDNLRKLKYYTTNHTDLLNARRKRNFFGIDIRDTLFTPNAESIDVESDLKQGSSGKLTNCKIKTGFGQLPLPTMPQRHQLSHNNSHLPLEYNMRFNHYSQNLKQKACLPLDTNFHDRHFYFFDSSNSGAEIPNPLHSVELPENCWNQPRGGISARLKQRPHL